MTSHGTYSDAIQALNSLQTNAIVLEKVRKERQRNVHLNLPTTVKYLERSGMTLEDLDTINVVHVSGTKGKGSTCAFCESILRQNGLKTGFYSSPHLVSATERIRLDGNPIDQNKFTEYFWDVYNKVCAGYPEDDRPPYFKFLTILAFNIFWREGVDVAVIEVGIGGSYDCTNIVRNPIVSGITALGLDHTSLLGNSIKDIAWHKSGIMKKGVRTYTDNHQQEAAMEVLQERAIELGAELATVPELDDYNWAGQPQVLGLYGDVQRNNASLALALAKHTMSVLFKGSLPHLGSQVLPVLKSLVVSGEESRGLKLTNWPGRTQVVDRGDVVYFLDGAHTEESMLACSTWFSQVSKLMTDAPPSGKVFKALLFNTTGDRDARSLLLPLAKLDLDLVIFCTNKSSHTVNIDQQNFTTNDRLQLGRCVEHLHTWTKLQAELKPPYLSSHHIVPAITIPCINDALLWLTHGRDPHLTPDLQSIPDNPLPIDLITADQIQLLTTGSLHLVGGVLGCLHPSIVPQSNTKQVNNTISHKESLHTSAV